MSSVFFTPKCPINPPPCASCSNYKRTKLAGMHSLLALNTKPSLRTNLFHVCPSLQFSNTSLKSVSCSYCPLSVCSPKFLKSSWDNIVYRLDNASVITFSFPFLCLITYGNDSLNSNHLACALVRPKGITNHSYNPNFVLKAVFHSSPNCMRIWWYPLRKSILVKIKEPLNSSSISSNRGIG